MDTICFLSLFFNRDFVFSSSNEFVDHLATIRLDDERVHQYPPKAVMIEIARILFKSVFEKKKKTICSFFLIVVVIQALTSYEQNVKQTAASYEYYAMQYFQTAKADKPVVKSNEKLFFFYSQKQFSNEEKTLDLCDKLARQCDELKVIQQNYFHFINFSFSKKKFSHYQHHHHHHYVHRDQQKFNQIN